MKENMTKLDDLLKEKEELIKNLRYEMNSDKNKNMSTVEKLEEQLQFKDIEFNKNTQEKSFEIDFLKNELEKLTAELNEKKSQFEEQNSKFKEQENTFQKKETLQTLQITILQLLIRLTEDNLTTVNQSKEKLKAELEQEKKIHQDLNKINEKKNEINNLKTRIIELEAIIHEKNMELKKLENKVESLFGNLNKLGLEQELLTAKISRIEENTVFLDENDENLKNMQKIYNAKEDFVINQFRSLVDEMTHSIDNHIVNFDSSINRIKSTEMLLFNSSD